MIDLFLEVLPDDQGPVPVPGLLQYPTWLKESRVWAKFASFRDLGWFGPKLAGLAGDTFLDRSRSSVGVGSSFFDMFQVWGFFFGFSFFVVSGSAEGSRKVPQIWLRSAGGRQIAIFQPKPPEKYQKKSRLSKITTNDCGTHVELALYKFTSPSDLWASRELRPSHYFEVCKFHSEVWKFIMGNHWFKTAALYKTASTSPRYMVFLVQVGNPGFPLHGVPSYTGGGVGNVNMVMFIR